MRIAGSAIECDRREIGPPDCPLVPPPRTRPVQRDGRTVRLGPETIRPAAWIAPSAVTAIVPAEPPGVLAATAEPPWSSTPPPTRTVMFPALQELPVLRRLLDTTAPGSPLPGPWRARSPPTSRRISPPWPPPRRFSAKIPLPALIVRSPVTVIRIGQASAFPDRGGSSLQLMVPSTTRSPLTVKVPLTTPSLSCADPSSAENRTLPLRVTVAAEAKPVETRSKHRKRRQICTADRKIFITTDLPET